MWYLETFCPILTQPKLQVGFFVVVVFGGLITAMRQGFWLFICGLVSLAILLGTQEDK